MSTSSYFLPGTIAEAVSLAKAHQDDHVFYAGGTDIQLHVKQRLIKPNTIIDLTAIESLKSMSIQKKNMKLGSMVTLDQIVKNPDIRKFYPILAEAAKSIATPVIRKSATLGGNLKVSNRCSFYNQSFDWRQSVGSCLKDTGDICQVTGGLNHCYSRNVSDLVPALIALNARIMVQTSTGINEMPLIDLYVPDGLIVHTPLGVGGIITEIFTSDEPSKWWFKKLRLRKSLDFTSLTVAATVNKKDVLRVCVNGVSMAPVLVETGINDVTLEGLILQVKRACKTVDNDYMPLKYRREMISAFITDCWNTFH